MDQARGVLWFCRLGWLSASADEVTSVIRRHAPGLWDDAHGLRATLPVAVLHKRRLVRAAGVFWAVFFAALGALGLIGFASAWQVATARGVCWLAVWGALGLYVLAIGLLPARLRVDRHGIGIRANLGRLDVAWPDVEDPAIRSGKHGPELLVRTVYRPFFGRLSIPYDPRTRTVTLVTAALAVPPDEFDAALARFAGHRWQGRQDAPDEPGDDTFGADSTLVGRLAGPRSKAARADTGPPARASVRFGRICGAAGARLPL
ncbi:hypothetical protein [Streptomyces shenzhenensis]|uniref:hypothetical protein n=1 Tax=Streptomyces shenzhenensis TaxID=943815 RepID=UPI0015F0768A|nr:hypothetical protein [Streptomyces shenzhenensis]